VLLAPACAACDALLDAPTRGCICAVCWSRVLLIAPPVCEHCGIPLPSWRSHASDVACARCRRQDRALDRGRAAGLYEGALRDIIHAFKYGARRSLAAPLAALMRAQATASGLFDGVDAIVPVPLHRARQRTRGFNQAEALARALKQRAPVLRALQRIRATQPQTDLPAAQRHRNVRGAFALARGFRAAPRVLARTCVLLVDDVSTTGATLEACARVLKAGGVREVRAVTVARAVLPRAR
jgi:ComF family protein